MLMYSGVYTGSGVPPNTSKMAVWGNKQKSSHFSRLNFKVVASVPAFSTLKC